MSDDSVTNLQREGEIIYRSPISEKVIQAVADREGVDPTELHPPLYNAVNPEALDSLFENENTNGRLQFHWLDYRIVVFSSRSVRIIDEDIDTLEK